MKTVRLFLLIASAALCVGAASAQAPKPVALALPRTSILDIASPDNHCPVEPNAKAINPEIVECHAKFAPVPTLPPFLDQTTPAQREEYGRWLAAQLDQPGVCDDEVAVSRYQACAILIYALDPRRRIIGAPRAANYDGPWTYVVKIYRVSPAKNARDASIEFVFADDRHGEYASNEVWNLLAEQRAAERCSRVKSQSYLHDNSMRKQPDSCRRTDRADVRFYPTLILPRSKASLVLNPDAITFHFRAPELQDAQPRPTPGF